MANDEPNRINVSRDALRADLAEMELRLRTWIDTQLNTKADSTALVALNQKVADLNAKAVMRDGPLMQDIRRYESDMRSLSEGNFTDAQKRALQLLMDANLKDHTDSGWTMRQRYIAVAALFVSIAAIIASIYLALHYAGG
jgi:hypothetical protein